MATALEYPFIPGRSRLVADLLLRARPLDFGDRRAYLTFGFALPALYFSGYSITLQASGGIG